MFQDPEHDMVKQPQLFTDKSEPPTIIQQEQQKFYNELDEITKLAPERHEVAYQEFILDL